MNDVLELEQESPIPPRSERVRELFTRMGGAMSTRALARACLDAGIWDTRDRELIVLRSVQNSVRTILTGAGDLPEAGPTTERDNDGAPIWKPRQGWLFPDYELNVRDRLTQETKLRLTIDALCRECEGRYGKAPEIIAVEDRQN